jgi:uncharacterized protein (DUF58 family)
VITFGGRTDRLTPPAGGRQGLLATLLATRNESIEPVASPDTPLGQVSPAAALRFVTNAAPRGGLVVVVSDFRGPRDWLRPLGAAAARHQVLAVEIRDPREGELPDVGELTLVDAETGREVRVDTSSRTLRARFTDAAAEERASLARDLRRLAVGHVVLSTSGSWLRSLTGQLRTLGIAS